MSDATAEIMGLITHDDLVEIAERMDNPQGNDPVPFVWTWEAKSGAQFALNAVRRFLISKM